MKTPQKIVKGMELALLHNWDAKGTVSVRRVRILSAGKHQIHCECVLSSKPIKDRLYTEQVNKQAHKNLRYGQWLVALETAQADALELAEMFLAYEREQLDHALQIHSNDAGYCRVIRKNIAELHAPTVIDYPVKM